jgi:hypothetical protein
MPDFDRLVCEAYPTADLARRGVVSVIADLMSNDHETLKQLRYLAWLYVD